MSHPSKNSITNKAAKSPYFFAGLLCFFLALLFTVSFSQANQVTAVDHTLNYTIDRSQLPNMNYYAMTLNINVGSVSSATVRNGSGTVIPSTYNSSTGTLTVTTDETTIAVSLSNFSGSTDEIGQLTIATLKDNKRWAWSHGFDDNAGFLRSIYQFEQNNVPATLYLNDYSSGFGNIIVEEPGKTNPPNPYVSCDDNNNSLDPINYECFLLTGSKIRQLLDDGWAIGNHTEDHTCWFSENDKPSDTALWQGITNVQAKLYSKIVNQSNRTDYIINSFAAPCFNDYNPLLQQKISENATDIIMSEGGFIDYSSPDGFSGASNVIPLQFGYDFTQAVIRDNRIEGEMGNDSDDAASLTFTKAMFDWLHNNSFDGNINTYWYNTISHNSNEDVFVQAIPYLINTYGSNSSFDEVWTATAEEVYAYLYMREKAQISLLCSSTIGDCNSNPVITPDPVPGANQILGRVFNDLNQNGIDDNEPGVEDARIIFWNDANCDGNLDFGNDYGGDTRSSANGAYLFDGLDSNSCYVLQFDPDSVVDVTISSMNVGTNDSIDSDFYPNGFTDSVSLPAAAVNLGMWSTSMPVPTETTTPTSQETPTPAATPLPTSTPTQYPTPTPLPDGYDVDPVLENNQLADGFSQESWPSTFQISDGGFVVNYEEDYSALRIAKDPPAYDNLLALTFEISEATQFTHVDLVWTDDNNAFVEASRTRLILCPGSYTITENIPSLARGFGMQEASAEKIGGGFYSFHIQNIQFVSADSSGLSSPLPASRPECNDGNIYLPATIR